MALKFLGKRRAAVTANIDRRQPFGVGHKQIITP